MAKRNWWNETSAADDGSLDDDDAVIVDDDDETDGSWLDDFRFDDYRLGAQATIGGFWGRYGVSDRTDTAKRIAAAQSVVQGFVDTFATGDLPYRVTFSDAVETAGTDFRSRSVVVSHKPLFDPTLSDDDANTVLTAMAVHEASHVRYGRPTSKAVDVAFARDRNAAAASRISNILDDVRIERRFVEDYPGYAEVFAPAIAYVARSQAHGRTVRADALAPIDAICAAVRYTDHVDFDGVEAERDFWLDWAERGTADDSPETHVAAVREAIARLQLAKQAEREQPTTDGGQGGQSEPTDDGDESDETGTGGSAESDDETDGESGQNTTGDVADDESDDETGSGSESDETESGSESGSESGTDASDETVDDTNEMGGCFGGAIDHAATENGETSALTETEAQELVEQGKAIVTNADGETGEVYWSADNVARGRSSVAANPGAASAIRAAFMRSRTGHFDVEGGQKSGRLDNRSLTRVASNDYRLFNRRTAPSEGRYLVWLLVDCSGSMGGHAINDATSVAAALAAASRGLPTVRLDIWGWTDGFRLGGSFGAARVWTTGQDIASVGALPNLPMGGTPDAEVLSWAAAAIKAQARRDEQPVIILASDGQGSLAYDTERIAKARRSGVEVVSVALGSGVRSDAQERMYGPRGYIPWAGTIAKTAGPLGNLISRIVSGRRAA